MSELSADLTDVSPAHPAGSLSWLILLALAVGGFGIGTGEFVIMGLMPTIAADLGVTEPQVGHVISSYALGVVVGAPILAIFGARLRLAWMTRERRCKGTSHRKGCGSIGKRSPRGKLSSERNGWRSL